MEAGYDPARIDELGRRTIESLERLAQLTSGDPMAADAVRTIRLTRRNLEDHWLPALRDIESSDAMVSWKASHLEGWRGRSLSDAADALPDHLRPGGLHPLGALTLTDDERDAMLGQLDWLERKAMGSDDLPGRPTAAELDSLAEQLASWVPRDAELRRQLIEASTSDMLVGGLLLRADFPTSFLSAVITTMSSQNGPDTGVDRERYATSLSHAFAAMVDDPAACLDLLIADNGKILYDIAAWSELDTGALSDFVTAGLHTAVVSDPTRLSDGYDALAGLTYFTSGPLGRGINAGVALGVARSMGTYLDTLTMGLDYSGTNAAVDIIDARKGLDVRLGSFADVRGLFGVMLRHPEARDALEEATTTWTDTTLRTAEWRVLYDDRVTRVSHFATMLTNAADIEQVEMIVEAADAEKANKQFGEVVGVLVDITAAVNGAPPLARRGFSWAIDAAASVLGDVDAEEMPGPRLGAEIHRQMVISSVLIGLASPQLFDDEGADTPPTTAAQRREIRSRIAAIERADNTDDRNKAVTDLTTYVDTYVPALLSARHSITENEAAGQLTDD